MSSAATTAAANGTKPFFRVTLVRSTIGLPAKTRQYAKSLHLTKMHRPVLMPATASSAGNLLKLKELIKVENVALPRGVSPLRALYNEKQARKPFDGFRVVGSAVPKTW
ncbi:ribosomal protein L30 [Allomyces macrogynus ATCC 38327]|uniref:Large ribosomal subunit protein uL30m n=1 Tax=Allomyces macrogynus (strain ATCC 38327) TaxID=578462 RepID=A0A0L0RVK2_ALLM3|nr:ribosomal protein L30 [Allomyces macrogynus ATCC 38327]|eukprot:KNE54343.1 ribosomal protein L30 [Allomyces macrogynus ATCC 38327]